MPKLYLWMGLCESWHRSRGLWTHAVKFFKPRHSQSITTSSSSLLCSMPPINLNQRSKMWCMHKIKSVSTILSNWVLEFRYWPFIKLHYKVYCMNYPPRMFALMHVWFQAHTWRVWGVCCTTLNLQERSTFGRKRSNLRKNLTFLFILTC